MLRNISQTAFLLYLLVLVSCQSTAIYTSRGGSERERKPIEKSQNNQTQTLKGKSGKKGKIEYMTASWVGNERHGTQTESGIIFNMYDLVAGHKNLAFGSRLKLINEINGNEVILIINDRNKTLQTDIIVSYKVAEELGILDSNSSTVKVVYLN